MPENPNPNQQPFNINALEEDFKDSPTFHPEFSYLDYAGDFRDFYDEFIHNEGEYGLLKTEGSPDAYYDMVLIEDDEQQIGSEGDIVVFTKRMLFANLGKGKLLAIHTATAPMTEYNHVDHSFVAMILFPNNMIGSFSGSYLGTHISAPKYNKSSIWIETLDDNQGIEITNKKGGVLSKLLEIKPSTLISLGEMDKGELDSMHYAIDFFDEKFESCDHHGIIFPSRG